MQYSVSQVSIDTNFVSSFAQLDIAKKCGPNVIALNPAKVNLKKEIDALTEGYGCDVYIELTGNPQSVRQGLDCIARHGRFVEYAVFGKEVTADWSIIREPI